MSISFARGGLAQVAIVVRDIEQAKTRWALLLGVSPPETVTTEPGDVCRMSYNGQPSNAQCKLTFFDLGGVQLELIEPLGGRSTWQEVLDRRGEGLHHIAFWTDEMASSAAILGEAGANMVQRGDMGEGQYAYFDGEERLGCMIELLEKKRKE